MSSQGGAGDADCDGRDQRADGREQTSASAHGDGQGSDLPGPVLERTDDEVLYLPQRPLEQGGEGRQAYRGIGVVPGQRPQRAGRFPPADAAESLGAGPTKRGIAVALRIVLLFALMKLIHYFRDPLFSINAWQWLEGTFNLHSIIVLVGGVFIMYTATREILHMMELEGVGQEERKPTSAGIVIFYIVAMNLVFSFDSILAAMALSDQFWVMATAITSSSQT